jgi:hypothetical protein
MRRFILFGTVLLAFLALGFSGSPAQAQATRTWVSGVGSDGNPCSRTFPCLTWAGAIAQTAAGGEIDALDPGGFGAVTITKAITLDGGGGQVASILAAGGTNGITVAAGPNDVVIIRNMRINGLLGTATPGAYGIYFTSGAVLSVENCTIFGFGAAGGAGIYASTSGNSTLNVTNTNITNNLNGIYMTPGGNLYGSIDHTTIQKMSGFGIFAGNGGGSVIVTVTNSNILNAAVNGVFAYGAGAVLDIDTSSVTNNNTAFANNGGIIRISRNVIYDNNTNFTITGGGTIATSGDNYVAVNGATVPNGSITQQ